MIEKRWFIALRKRPAETLAEVIFRKRWYQFRGTVEYKPVSADADGWISVARMYIEGSPIFHPTTSRSLAPPHTRSLERVQMALSSMTSSAQALVCYPAGGMPPSAPPPLSPFHATRAYFAAAVKVALAWSGESRPEGVMKDMDLAMSVGATFDPTDMMRQAQEIVAQARIRPQFKRAMNYLLKPENARGLEDPIDPDLAAQLRALFDFSDAGPDVATPQAPRPWYEPAAPEAKPITPPEDPNVTKRWIAALKLEPEKPVALISFSQLPNKKKGEADVKELMRVGGYFLSEIYEALGQSSFSKRKGRSPSGIRTNTVEGVDAAFKELTEDSGSVVCYAEGEKAGVSAAQRWSVAHRATPDEPMIDILFCKSADRANGDLEYTVLSEQGKEWLPRVTAGLEEDRFSATNFPGRGAFEAPHTHSVERVDLALATLRQREGDLCCYKEGDEAPKPHYTEFETTRRMLVNVVRDCLEPSRAAGEGGEDEDRELLRTLGNELTPVDLLEQTEALVSAAQPRAALRNALKGRAAEFSEHLYDGELTDFELGRRLDAILNPVEPVEDVAAPDAAAPAAPQASPIAGVPPSHVGGPAEGPAQEWFTALGSFIIDKRMTAPLPDIQSLPQAEKIKIDILYQDFRDWLNDGLPQCRANRSFSAAADGLAPEPFVVLTSDLTGVACINGMVTDCPPWLTWLTDEEFAEFKKAHPDDDYRWHMQHRSVFRTTFDDVTLEALKREHPIPEGAEYWMHEIETNFAKLGARGMGHLWSWDGEKETLVKELYSEWVS